VTLAGQRATLEWLHLQLVDIELKVPTPPNQS